MNYILASAWWKMSNSPSSITNVTTTVQSIYIKIIPTGTVDNNLGQDHLAGPKALDPIFADNTPFGCTSFVWKS